MENLIRAALEHCGYTDEEPTEELLQECFLNRVDEGVFGNLTPEEAKDMIADGEITVEVMCRNLLRTR
ncbi:hypothetical protein [Bacillus sp. T33-2]|uniref:hypothetical protein n=1 Tax=Bacillus sp. T33-2 TaxID=2054168 RepID=UPI000C794D73|nr:hypothetical protein [Bacillus sp. T33-2]PLR99580.1 hypothetical protein CVD19_00525 [Bacillus sp. T33-2]